MRPHPRTGGRTLAAAAILLLAAADVGAAQPKGGPVTSPTVQRVHVVARGETLSGIAARYKVGLGALLAANHLGKHAVLRVGQRLILPVGAARLPATVARPARRATAVGAARKAAAPREPRDLELSVPDFVETAPPFVWPVDGSVISTFGLRRAGWHRGIDIKAEQGRAVFAAAPGIVVVSAVEPRYGWVVKIEHDDGFLTVYAHNEENLVEVGTRVALGDPIATIGRTGQATTHHLHFEIRRGGAVYNPLYLLPLPPRVGEVDLVEETQEEHE